MEYMVIGFAATVARFALDPIGWLTIAGGAIIYRQTEKWTVVFLLSAAMTILNAILISNINERGLPLPRFIIIFFALTVLGFIGYLGMLAFKKSQQD
jgi:hypothetical protein